ncbi:uncharacterized protein LOC141713353 [Apium graveolens]|uniref:uncharacterized protein LOC141713353 n=1 Tax=Apium graveolens TaxID=4045 RepID=UPI003D78D3A9
MADNKNAHHVVEIPVDEEHRHKILSAMTTISAIQNHPLMEISNSPGHLLLLKLWQTEEDLYSRKLAKIESRLDSIRSEIFQLCCFFFLFHGFFLTILSAPVAYTNNVKDHVHVCHRWWVPSLLSLSTSLALILLVQVKLCRYWKVWKQLQGERTDNRSLTRCIQELRMKGASFDLSKEPVNAKRMKSSSVEIKWKPMTWCSQSLITICLLCLTALLFPASRFILCV